MANLEPCFRSQILCGRYFNLPCTLLHQLGYAFSMCTHTHSLSIFCNDFLMFSACSVTGKEKNVITRPFSSCKTACIQEKTLFHLRKEKIEGGYFSCTAVKIWKGNTSFFLCRTGWITDCRGAFTRPQLRRDWQGERLRGLQQG